MSAFLGTMSAFLGTMSAFLGTMSAFLGSWRSYIRSSPLPMNYDHARIKSVFHGLFGRSHSS